MKTVELLAYTCIIMRTEVRGGGGGEEIEGEEAKRGGGEGGGCRVGVRLVSHG